MGFWDRLSKYRQHGPQAVGALALQPLDVFRRILGEIADEELQPLGWSRGLGLRWSRPVQVWADQVIELESLRSAIGIRWGLNLSFVPALKKRRGGGRELDFSYNPLDYERDVTPWTISQFATDEELRSETRALVQRAMSDARSFDVCSRDLHSLVKCFENKKERKYRRFGFQHYPQEILAYATVLGLVGRQNEALKELDTIYTRLNVSAAEQKRVLQNLMDVWAKKGGFGAP